MDKPKILFEKLPSQVGVFEIDAPPSNALGQAARREFLAHLDAIEDDKSIRALVVTGRGKHFCSGDDLKEREAALQADGEASTTGFPVLVDRLESFRVPVIAAVNGWAVGGGLELALGCDIRLASNAARFVCAAVNVGLIASAYRLPRLIGMARAKHMLLTGLPFDTETAERFGLVTGCFAPEALKEAALKLAERIATRAPLSVEATKRVTNAALDLNTEEASRALTKEFKTLVASRDHAEALSAFREKRIPIFHRR